MQGGADSNGGTGMYVSFILPSIFYILNTILLFLVLFFAIKTLSQDKDSAISDEISTLKDVIKCILDRCLELEYSADMLREKITCLEAERENTKKSMPADITNNLNPVEKEQLGQRHTRKRPAPDSTNSERDVQPSPSKKMLLRHKNENFSNDR